MLSIFFCSHLEQTIWVGDIPFICKCHNKMTELAFFFATKKIDEFLLFSTIISTISRKKNLTMKWIEKNMRIFYCKAINLDLHNFYCLFCNKNGQLQRDQSIKSPLLFIDKSMAMYVVYMQAELIILCAVYYFRHF